MSTETLSQDALASRIETLLAGKDSVVVEAGALTDFGWDSLCFERDSMLLLRFRSAGMEQVVSLPYEKFFVDEGYVPGSLEDTCVKPADRIVVKKKYPGYEGPYEFLKAEQGG